MTAMTFPPVHTSVAAPTLTVATMRGDRSIIESLAPEWNDLCNEGPCQQPFFTPAYLQAWMEAFAPEGELVIVTARRGKRLRGVFALLATTSSWRGKIVSVLRAPTNYYSGRTDLVHGNDDVMEVSGAIWDEVRNNVAWDVIEYRDVAEGSAFDRLARRANETGFPVTIRTTLRSPTITFEPDDDLTIFGPQSRMKRSTKHFAKLGVLELVRTSPADTGALQRFFDMEASGWKGEAGTAVALDPEAITFFTAILTNEQPGFTPAAYELQLDGKTVAGELGTQSGTIYVNHKRAYDEEFRKQGPGHLLIRDVLLDLGQRGIREFDLLGNDEPYKLEWTSTVRQHYHYLIFRNSPKGRLLHRGLESALPHALGYRRQLSRVLQGIRQRSQQRRSAS